MSAEEAQITGLCTLACSKAKYTQLTLESGMFEAEVGKNVLVDAHKVKRTAKNLFATLRSNRYRVFARLLRSHFTDSGEELNVIRHKRVQMPKFACVSSCRTSTLRDETRDGYIGFSDDKWRSVQRVVAAKSFHDSAQRSYDSFFVTKVRQVGRDGSSEFSRSVSVCCGSSLAFVRVIFDQFENKFFKIHQNKSCVKRVYDRRGKLYFVQWYEVVTTQLLKVDEIN